MPPSLFSVMYTTTMVALHIKLKDNTLSVNKCQAFKLLQRLFQKVASLFLALCDAGDTQRGSQLK